MGQWPDALERRLGKPAQQILDWLERLDKPPEAGSIIMIVSIARIGRRSCSATSPGGDEADGASMRLRRGSSPSSNCRTRLRA